MNEFLKMDIFFFVATLAVVVLAGATVFILWKVGRVLKHIEHISAQVSAETDVMRGDLTEMRNEIKKGKGRIKSLVGFFTKTAKRSKES
jgi:hypothetical protein